MSRYTDDYSDIHVSEYIEDHRSNHETGEAVAIIDPRFDHLSPAEEDDYYMEPKGSFRGLIEEQGDYYD